jgi:CHASE2 domain
VGTFIKILAFFHQCLDEHPKTLQHHLVKFAVVAALSLLALATGDKIAPQGAAVVRFLATAQAPYASSFYTEGAAKRISILLYDQRFLDTQGLAWPISYGDHAVRLARLVPPNSIKKPRAIFFDIVFGQARFDLGLDELRRELCRIHKDSKVPIFLAANFNPEKGRLEIRKGLDDLNGLCFHLVDIQVSRDSIDHVAWNYPLWQVGSATVQVETIAAQTRQRASAPKIMTAAHALAVIGDNMGPLPDSQLALAWGLPNQLPIEGVVRSNTVCSAERPSWFNLAFKALSKVLGQKTGVLCAHHPVNFFQDIDAWEESEVEAEFAGKFVLIGASLQGINDFVDSPVHGLIAGIHYHAMALDNLLTYGSKHKKSLQWEPPHGLPYLHIALLTILLMYIVFVFNSWTKKKLTSLFFAATLWKHNSTQKTWDQALRVESHRRKSQRFWNAVLWILVLIIRVSVVTILGLTVIAVLQSCSDLGALAVAEISAMTILVEGLGLTKKIRELLPSVEK